MTDAQAIMYYLADELARRGYQTQVENSVVRQIVWALSDDLQQFAITLHAGTLTVLDCRELRRTEVVSNTWRCRIELARPDALQLALNKVVEWQRKYDNAR